MNCPTDEGSVRVYSLCKRDLILTLKAFYKSVDKSKLKNVEMIADKYYMHQAALFRAIERKYKIMLILHISKRNEVDREGFVSNILDVYSMEFNPVEALAADVIALPFPEEKSLDRLYKFRRLLPEAHPDFNVKVNLGKIAPSEKSKNKREMKKAQKKNTRKESFIDVISNSFKSGPLSIMKRCFMEQRKVKIYTPLK